VPGDDGISTAAQMSNGISGFAAVFAEHTPDILVILGDRFDALPAALAAMPFSIPIAHISGGDVTEAVIDDAIRHCITKLSHIHFATNNDSANRILQLGEEPERVIVSGQPGLDALQDFTPKSRDQVATHLNLDPDLPITICTYHPESLTPERTKGDTQSFLKAAEQIDTQIVFTAPNTDPGSGAIREAILAKCEEFAKYVFWESLGQELYWHTLSIADCMVGNSSSGLNEAASFQLPVVNIGERQKGRPSSANVISCPSTIDNIVDAWRKALSSDFRKSLVDVINPYSKLNAVDCIIDTLASVQLGRSLLVKRFIDLSTLSDQDSR